MGWFDSLKNPKIRVAKKTESLPEPPTGIWQKCVKCSELLQASKLMENWNVCPFCSHHFRISAKDRVALLTDEGSFKSFTNNLRSSDPLKFEDKKPYGARLKEVHKKQDIQESAIAGIAQIDGNEFALAVMEFKFMGGSMGIICGELITQAMEMAYQKKIPCVVISSSGGARMQEGLLSLMQMAKTSAARARLRSASIPYISILTDPTTGGCAASFAMQGDIILAEPHALIGFAGPRVIEQSIRQVLPEGFQRSEFLLEKGFLDRVVSRKQLKSELSFIISFLKP